MSPAALDGKIDYLGISVKRFRGLRASAVPVLVIAMQTLIFH